MTRGSGFTRVLALVLCLCLTVPYLPVPGHAEGCEHVHGEACYQEVTQCVHTHGEDCWSDSEARDAGEEPDACAHVCGEDTGCVTKELNCTHTHDDTCGEQPQVEPEPEPEEPEPEEPKPEEPEEPQEPKDEGPKQEEENQSLVISRWQWVDEEEVLDPETGVLCLSSEEPILFEQVVELLPKAILATVGEEPQTIPLDHWDPKDYPQETGANSGSYLIEATLPEGYTLAEDAAPLTLHLEFAQAQALVECGHENVNMDTGMCKDCKAQVYVAKIGDIGYATLEAALAEAQKHTDPNTDCTVTMLCDFVRPGGGFAIFSGIFTLDMNEKRLVRDIYVWGTELTVRNGTVVSADDAFLVEAGLLKIESGYYKGRVALNEQGGTIVLSGGKFYGSSKTITTRQGRAIIDLIAPGKALYRKVTVNNKEKDELVDASGTEVSGEVYVLDHIEDYKLTNDGTYKCDCGRTCKHTGGWTGGVCNDCGMVCTHPNGYSSTDGKCGICGEKCKHTDVDVTTGKCNTCKMQLVAKIGDTGYATLDGALTAAQKNADCTVTVLCDCTCGSVEVSSGRFTLDLNEKTVDMTTTVTGGELTVKNGKIQGSNFGFRVEAGMLKIDAVSVGADDHYGIHNDGVGKVIISGGDFYGVFTTADGSVVDLLAEGKAFYKQGKNGFVLLDASSYGLDEKVYVLDHIDDYKPTTEGTYKCDCGRICKHPDVDMTTGKCNTCQKQLYVAKIGDTGYATLGEALAAAQMNADCTVTMLCDTDISNASYLISKGKFTLDLNGKEIKQTAKGTMSYIIGVDGCDLTITDQAQGDTPGAIYGYLIGGATPRPVTLYSGTLTIAGGNFTVKDTVAPTPIAIYATGGTLKITGGTMDGFVFTASRVNVFISGGVFNYDLENRSSGKFSLSGGIFYRVIDNGLKGCVELLESGYAFYSDAGRKNLVDASVEWLEPEYGKALYVLPHQDTYNATTGKCACGRTIPQATLDTAPAEAKLTYNGQLQNLVTPGTVTGGTLMYSLAENGTYTETVPTGKNADTYTVWYYVLGTPWKYYNTEKKSLTVTVGKKDLTPVVTIQDRDFDGTKEVRNAAVTLEGKEAGDELTYTLGTLEFDAAIPGTRTASLTGTPELKGKDAGNYNLKAPTGLTGKINATARYLDVTDSLPNADSVTIDGEEYPVTTENGKRYVNLSDTGSLLTVYSFVTGSDAHTSYPEGMKVFAIDRQDTGSTLAEIPEFENLLTYEGCSIRLNGTKGIRMITSIDQAKKKALVSSNLAGYTLVEYGTVITRESTLGGKTLNLQNVQSNNYNYAYSRANKKDPVFKTENGRIQYTNVLVNFQPADYKTELVLRPYIKLQDASGNEVTLYGGTVTRSIYYIAQQNINDYKPGSAGYKYLQEILGQK